jgi:hypothetical protein
MITLLGRKALLGWLEMEDETSKHLTKLSWALLSGWIFVSLIVYRNLYIAGEG